MPRRSPALAALLAALLVTGLALAGCSASPSGPGQAAGSSSSAGVPVPVVASTDVWGDIVSRIGGDAVTVTSIIDDPSRDPHEYESDPRAQLAVSRARLVVENGGGYDDFMHRLEQGASSATVVDVADVSGRDQKAAGGFNEHLWYDYGTVRRVVDRVTGDLQRLAPAHRADFGRRADALRRSLSALEARVRTLRAAAAGTGVAITEPVPLYLTSALGLVNRTPEAFSSAIEGGSDVAPVVLRQQLALFAEHRVALLAENEQTTGPTTDQVVAAAKQAGVPVVGVRETLPRGSGYVAWMNADLDAIQRALGR